MNRRNLLMLTGSCLTPAQLHAQQQRSWPSGRSIEIIVPFPPGGGMDVMARAFLPFLQAHLSGASFVIINRGGAGGQIGIEAVANAKPDGYTLGTAAFLSLVSMPIERQVRWRAADLTYLGNVVDDPCGLFVATSSPFKSLSDVVAAAKAQPGQLNFGIVGIGGDDHITMLLLEEAAGVRLSNVPFTGTAQMLTPLLGGLLELGAFNLSEGLPLVREGKIRALGLAAPERSTLAPQVPTYREQGIDLIGSASRGFFAPPGLPASVRDPLQAAFAAALADPAWLQAAERLALPQRPLVGEAYRDAVLASSETLNALWKRRPWKD
ncbi:Bug family tripartite tricarboxylate transporter substrate binding protein [Muricoccus pecuniae]|uniref:Tripartite-type tricarboxylate transporter receptor subunit TctC n=1 Tax=Muricoccus pecuniae TaxID=693023 RepID=A0A840Y5Z7_9PROT|nr:tripartite tricarboxylate transporter substrate binding protein [Roseomonas pecuniae]MBB5696165.1 tripartite-type tricarboxylate transporter receptor subunit TctC [Roseomonas pecuniae]